MSPKVTRNNNYFVIFRWEAPCYDFVIARVRFTIDSDAISLDGLEEQKKQQKAKISVSETSTDKTQGRVNDFEAMVSVTNGEVESESQIKV